MRCSENTYARLLLAAFVFILLLAGIKVVDKAFEDRTAFVRWTQHTERLLEGETIYGEAGGRYPNLPMMALLLIPFHALGPVAGSVAWFLFKFALVVFIFGAVVKVAEDRGPPMPNWLLLLLFLLSARVFMSDLTHGNVNLLIGALVVAALLLHYYSKNFMAGLSIGLAAVLKVTPALFVPYFLYKRQWRSAVGAGVGVLLFCWLVPGLVLGFGFNHSLVAQWYEQMIQPFIAGMPVDYMQTQHMNQSFTGILYRLLADTTAIAAEPAEGIQAVKVNLLTLQQDTVGLIVKGACLLVVLGLAWFCRTPREQPRHVGHLGEYALVFLAMLFLSERSWKHHYILLILAHGFLFYYLWAMRPIGWQKWLPLAALTGGVVLHTFTSSFFWGSYFSDVLEAYGVFVIGALFLFVGCASALAGLRRHGWPSRDQALWL